MKDWIFEKVAALFGPKYIGATTRTIVAAASGALLAAGIDPALVAKLAQVLDPVVAGLLTLAATWVWSIVQKYRHSD